ncbi:AcrB/AcrD/AcrF family protein [Methanolapillus millepedarum]|uniref:Uncharacterized protein n=1 Tax=Methanolapillus millepedarum TaxID=3028296 RepID=A0AA96VG29_9EURY|nr:hypothetical protein MsAc7_15040 [Methanosarcinaceae archaeon Ac7]
MSAKSTTTENKAVAKQGLAMQVFDIIFIFALAFACVVIPVYLKGATIVGEGGSGVGSQIVWNAPGYFSTLIVILIFFIVILYHSVKNYDY